MEEQIEITKLKKSDLQAFLLIAKVYYPAEEWLTIDYLKKLLRDSVVTRAVRWNGRFLGAIFIKPDKAPHYWMELIVIDKNMQRRKLGEKLYKAAEEQLESGDNLWHMLPDIKAFEPGKKFLIKMDFEEHGSLDEWFADRKDGLAYRKIIK